MKRIVQLIPYDGIGGVEIAAHSVPTGCHGNMNFERQYLVKAPGVTRASGEYHGLTTSQNNPLAYWHALWRLYRDPPDLLVASLWRSALVLVCLKILSPKTKAVVFLHAARPTHLWDNIINWLAMGLSDAIWADSRVTIEQRVSHRLLGRATVLSFLLNRRPVPEARDPAPNFVFWGRICAQKGLERALKLFSIILRHRQDARFTIIGPDGGMEDHLKAQVESLGLLDQVVFRGPLRHEDIAKEASCASFYLQTSLYEGMAMSVIEAMQNGLVPVVTPVGEISYYCHDKVNAVVIRNNAVAVNEVLALISDPDRYRLMSTAAAQYWQTPSLYRDDFLVAAKQLLEED